MTLTKTDNCVFCQISPNKNNLLIEKNRYFYLAADAAPLGTGHLLLIPKKHISCFGNLPKSIDKDFYNFKNKIEEFLEKNFGKYIIFEHGIWGQTVNHAHLHFLPTNKKVLLYINKRYDTKKIADFSRLKNILKEENGYLYLQDDKKDYIVLAKDIRAGFFHKCILNKLLNVSQEFNERAKKAKKNFKQINTLWKNTD